MLYWEARHGRHHFPEKKKVQFKLKIVDNTLIKLMCLEKEKPEDCSGEGKKKKKHYV